MGPSPATATRARKQPSDVTFLVVSDTHLGFGGIEKDNRAAVAKMNAIAGREYPPALGGKVDAPRGLLVTGDLTEWGKVDEWQAFTSVYGLEGKEAALGMPVFEVIGNHDKVHGPWVGDRVAERHRGRTYAWDWDDLHLVALSEAPDDDGLRFLAHDLERVSADVPVILYFHLALEGPWSTGNWFGDGDFKDRLERTIRGHRVVAIFHGHHHFTEHYVWRGIDVFKPGAIKHDAHTFAVVHVTDRKFAVGSFDWRGDTWASSFQKPIPPVATR